MKLHEWKTRIQSGEHLLGTMVTTFASADLPKILKACGRETAVSTRNLMTLARYFGLSMQELIDAFSGQ